MKKKEKLIMNLQLFADRDEPEFDEQGRPLVENPLFSEDEGQPPEGAGPAIEGNDPSVVPEGTAVPEGEPATNPEGNPEDDFDVKSYLEQLNEQIQELKPAGPEGAAESTEPTEEELQAQLEQQNDEFLNEFYENPMGKITELAKQIADQQLQPIMQERQQEQQRQHFDQTISEFEKTHPDFNDYVESVIEKLQTNPEISNSPKALELAYKLAKADSLEKAPHSVDDLLADESNMEKLLQNETLRDRILQDHMSNVSNKRPPQGIREGSSGQAPLHGGESPTTLKEGTEKLMEYLRKG